MYDNVEAMSICWTVPLARVRAVLAVGHFCLDNGPLSIYYGVLIFYANRSVFCLGALLQARKYYSHLSHK